MRRSADIKRFYSGYSDSITEKRFNSGSPLRRYVHSAQYESILNYVEPGTSVLDAGCGEGNLSIKMAEKGAMVTACDISQPNINNAIAYANKNGIFGISFVCCDLEHLPFPDNSFDLVISSHVLEHLPDFDTGLKEIMRVTRRRAVVAIPTLPNPCSLVQVGGGWFYIKGLRSFLALPLGFLKMLLATLSFKEGVDESYGGGDVPHVFRFPSVMKRKIYAHNFKLIEHSASSICLPYFDSLLPIIRFFDKFKNKIILRGLGYGTTFVIEK